MEAVQHPDPEVQAQLDAKDAEIAQLQQQFADAAAAQVQSDTPATPTPVQPTAATLSDDYTSLSLEAHRDAEAGKWRFGVSMGGAFIVLLERKLGGVDDDLREAQQPGFQAQRADLYQRELLAQRG